MLFNGLQPTPLSYIIVAERKKNNFLGILFYHSPFAIK